MPYQEHIFVLTPSSHDSATVFTQLTRAHTAVLRHQAPISIHLASPSIVLTDFGCGCSIFQIKMRRKSFHQPVVSDT